MRKPYSTKTLIFHGVIYIFKLNYERDEHKLVVDILGKLESERKAFRLVGSVLVERTVGDVLPTVSQNFDGVSIVSFCNTIIL